MKGTTVSTVIPLVSGSGVGTCDIGKRIFLTGIGSHFDFIARHFFKVFTSEGFARTPGQRGIELDFFLFHFLLVSLFIVGHGLGHLARDFFRLSHRLRRSNIRQHELHHALQNFDFAKKYGKADQIRPADPDG